MTDRRLLPDAEIARVAYEASRAHIVLQSPGLVAYPPWAEVGELTQRRVTLGVSLVKVEAGTDPPDELDDVQYCVVRALLGV